MNRVDDLLEAVRINELLNRKKVEEEKNDTLKVVLIVIGIVAVVAVAVFAIYRFVTPDYLEDFDDDFEDDFDDDFFEDEDIVVEESDSKEDKKSDK